MIQDNNNFLSLKQKSQMSTYNREHAGDIKNGFINNPDMNTPYVTSDVGFPGCIMA